ncbi:hypothetical protein C4577_07215 [Candidatus Parcubacteria bacterium]|nr:MAG: hypothetical protein C4577_07215 [Candidatus Parcubacteria bacterium]
MTLEREPIIEDDMYSDNLGRRKLYWVQNAASEVDRVLDSISRELTAFPQISRETLQTGESGNSITLFMTIPQAVLAQYREQAVSFIGEMRSLAHEKGFRFEPALLTSKEHKNISSSGYGGIFWDTDPDVPIPILRDRLVAEGKLDQDRSETYTLEEVDRARRLAGMTKLDLATGRVTDEIDQKAADNSYYFLSPERQVEVVRREDEILTEIERITKTALAAHKTARDILPSLVAYADGEITTPALKAQYEILVERTTETYGLSLTRQIRELKRLAVETGKWDYILTPQEIMLRSGGSVDPRYLAQPYTPLAIQDGTDVEKVTDLRQGEQSITVNTSLLEYEMPFGFRLEELDAQGNTVKSPTFLSRDDGETVIEDERFCEYYGQQIKFPFARPTDWFCRENPASGDKQ